MPEARRWRRVLVRVASGLVVASSLAFVGLEIWRHDPWRLAEDQASEIAGFIAGGTVIYALAGFLLAEAWRQLLGPGAAEARRGEHRALYGRAQIAKYLPGNVFHFIGRQVLGGRLGHSHATLALATLAEALLLLLVAGGLALPLARSPVERILAPGPGWLLITAAGALGAVAYLIARRLRDSGVWSRFSMRASASTWAPRLLRAGLLHVAFFTLAGLLLWAGAAAIQAAGERTLRPTTALSIFALAWSAGFVVPGAPAGLGVREAALMLALAPYLERDGAMVLALALRVITTLGDLLFFALCSIPSPGRPPR